MPVYLTSSLNVSVDLETFNLCYKSLGLQDIPGQLINTSLTIHQILNWKMAFSLRWPEALFKCTQRGRDGWSRRHTGMPCHLSRRTDSQGQNQSDYQWDPSPFKAQETHISWNTGREMRGVIIIWSICNFFSHCSEGWDPIVLVSWIFSHP